MLDAERDAQAVAITASLDRSQLRERIKALGRELGREELRRTLELVDDASRPAESLRDAVSTRLMEAFRQRASRGAFGLLYELNSHHLQSQVAGCLRRYGSRSDPRDVLQEVFFNVYRYPHRFDCQREDAFRVWSAMIVRNTVLKHLRSHGRAGRVEVPFEDLSDRPEERGIDPLRGVIDSESTRECGRVYLTYLHLYLRFYSMLSERERRAIHLVEVEEHSYREAAADLGIKLENLKMVIFRARRKIHRSMRRVFEGLPPDCRPARDPGPPTLAGRRRTLVGRPAGELDERLDERLDEGPEELGSSVESVTNAADRASSLGRRSPGAGSADRVADQADRAPGGRSAGRKGEGS